MNDAWEFHKTAMALLSKADKQINKSTKKYLYLQAYELEKDAAQMLQKASSRFNQRRSLIFYTAVSMALFLEKGDEARMLIKSAEEQEIHPSLAEEWLSCKNKIQHMEVSNV